MCAKVEATVAAMEREATSIPATTDAPSQGAFADPSGASADSDLEQWLAGQKLAALLGPLQALGVHVLEDLPVGITGGDITVESLVSAGAKSHVQARRMIQAANTAMQKNSRAKHAKRQCTLQ